MLRLTASVEDIDFRQPRGLDKGLVLELAACRWIKERQNFLNAGPGEDPAEIEMVRLLVTLDLEGEATEVLFYHRHPLVSNPQP